jgi:hypothetical protein
MRRRSAVLFILLAVGALLAPPGRAQESNGVSFTRVEPEGWSWWCREATCALLPDDAAGSQRRFLLVADVPAVDGLTAGWLGGGRIVWEGVVATRAGECRGRIAANDRTRGFIGASDAWAVAAIAPRAQWEEAAAIYNAVLREER